MQERGIEVYLVGPMIEYDEPFPRLLAMSLRDHRPELVAAHLASGQQKLDLKLAELAHVQWHVPYISYFKNLCTSSCLLYGAPGIPLLFDEHHLTAAGSMLFVQSIRDRHELLLARSDAGRKQPNAESAGSRE